MRAATVRERLLIGFSTPSIGAKLRRPSFAPMRDEGVPPHIAVSRKEDAGLRPVYRQDCRYAGRTACPTKPRRRPSVIFAACGALRFSNRSRAAPIGAA